MQKWMKYAIAVMALTAFALVTTVKAQATKQVLVTFSQPVVIGETTLEPGDYKFIEVSDHVLQVLNRDDEMRAEAAVITIDTENKEPSENTEFVLTKLAGNPDHFIAKLWVQGRSRGFEFVMPERFKSLKQELEESVAGRYEEREPQGLK